MNKPTQAEIDLGERLIRDYNRKLREKKRQSKGKAQIPFNLGGITRIDRNIFRKIWVKPVSGGKVALTGFALREGIQTGNCSLRNAVVGSDGHCKHFRWRRP